MILSQYYIDNEITACQDYIDNILISTGLSEEKRIQYYHQCPECNKPNTHISWCNSCNAARFRKAFSTWTSGNAKIDYFIQNAQLYAWCSELILEWFPWNKFSEIENIGRGSGGTVFRAKVTEWKMRCNEIGIDYNGYVALKAMEHSDSKNFLNEVIFISLFIVNPEYQMIDFSHF